MCETGSPEEPDYTIGGLCKKKNIKESTLLILLSFRLHRQKYCFTLFALLKTMLFKESDSVSTHKGKLVKSAPIQDTGR